MNSQTTKKRELTSRSEALDLERNKMARQEQSRTAVIAGQRTSRQNSFIPQDLLRGATYTFKG